MELFDVVDEMGNPTGETIERSEAHANGVRHRTAHIWISREVEGRRQVLLQKRALNKDSFPGGYDTSSAGHIHAGCEPLESALRELEEELGIKAKPSQLEFAGTFKIQYEEEFYNKLFKDNEIAFVFVYLEDVDINKLIIQKEELDCVEWFDLNETYEKCLKHDSKFCVPIKGLEIAREYLDKFHPIKELDWTKNCNSKTVDIPAFISKMEQVKAGKNVEWSCPFCNGKVVLMENKDGHTVIGCSDCDMRINLDSK